MDEPILRVEDLSVAYTARRERVSAVRGVTFEVRSGETFGLVGESGCGKSTVAYAAMGFVAKNAEIAGGRVLFSGHDLAAMPRHDLRHLWGREIAMVYQDPDASLNPSVRVGDQIGEVLRAHKGFSHGEARREAVKLLDSVRLTDPARTATNYPHELSGGMKQRVCIAMALACGPRLLVMDEPTTALDVTTEAAVLDLVGELKRARNMAILYITHDLGVVARVCDHVGVMYVGRLVEVAPVRALFSDPRHPYTRGLLSCIPKLGETKDTTRLAAIPGVVGRAGELGAGCPFEPRCWMKTARCSDGEPGMVEVAPGHRAACDRGGAPPRHADPQDAAPASPPEATASGALLSAHDLRYYHEVTRGMFSGGLFGGPLHVRAVDGVSFAVPKNATLAVVGESGCGKSTLARCILGFNEPQGGSLTFAGQDIATGLSRRDRDLLRKITIVFQNPEATLNPKHTVGYAVGRPLALARGLAGEALRSEVASRLAAVNLSPDYAARYPRELSGGEKQRVAIARAFASGPDLVVCDEPTSALDVSVQASILTLFLDLQRRFGTSYVFISHDMSVVRYLSDVIAVMYLGRFCEVGRAGEVFSPPCHPYTEALLSAIPVADPAARQKTLRLSGRVPNLLSPPSGCRFNSRCPRKLGEICEREDPPEVWASPTHRIACHIPIETLRTFDPVISRE